MEQTVASVMFPLLTVWFANVQTAEDADPNAIGSAAINEAAVKGLFNTVQILVSSLKTSPEHWREVAEFIET
jgi:hypothetical protein